MGIMRSTGHGRGGFTLIEIILVVVIIMTLAAIAGPKIVGKAKQARQGATVATISNIKTALTNFEMHADHFPSTSEGLQALMTKPSGLKDDQWAGPYLDNWPTDGWKRNFRYVCPSSNPDKDYDIISDGPDGQPNTKDDITNVVSKGPDSGSGSGGAATSAPAN